MPEQSLKVKAVQGMPLATKGSWRCHKGEDTETEKESLGCLGAPVVVRSLVPLPMHSRWGKQERPVKEVSQRHAGQ